MSFIKKAVLCALGLLLIPLPAEAAPFPPQLPSEAEMKALEQTLASALSQVRASQSALNQVVAEYEREQDRFTQLAGEILSAQLRQETLDAELRGAQAAMDNRASAVYRAERIGVVSVLLEARSFSEFLTAFDFLQSVTRQDTKAMMRVRDLRAQAVIVRTELETQKVEQQKLIGQLAKKRSEVDRLLAAAAVEFRGIQAEIDKRKQGFAFPVRPPYSYTDSYGAPRMEGTSYYHRHEGTDIFAGQGTPIVAVVDGIIENVGTASLGGIKLWLRSPGDNWTYYYAHMSGYAAGIRSGLRVKKGDVLGYVGNTGNARGTPPHLHFETHVPSGAATNPYPILRRVDITR